MNARPSAWRRMSQTGIPLLLVRLLLGGMFIWMGLAKTGMPKLLLTRAGVINSSTVQTIQKMGLIDLSGPVDFLKLIREYEMFPDSLWRMLNLTAVVLPWVEVLCGLLLILGVAVRGSSLLLLALLIMFTTMIIIRAVHIYHATGVPFCTIKFDCGCGAGEVLICHKVPENLALSLLALGILFSPARRLCLRKDLIPSRSAIPL